MITVWCHRCTKSHASPMMSFQTSPVLSGAVLKNRGRSKRRLEAGVYCRALFYQRHLHPSD